jgi:predicted metal-dependent hydrolase
MRIQEVTPRRSRATKQAMATRRLYQTEAKIIEQIWAMRRPRSLRTLQAALDLLWDHYAPLVGTRRLKPRLRFGPGTRYHGRSFSYTMDTRPGQLIELAPDERNFYVLIHELVHAFGPSQHGIRFAQIYHDLLQHDTFREMMSTPEGMRFLDYLRQEHPRYVRRAYRG